MCRLRVGCRLSATLMLVLWTALAPAAQAPRCREYPTEAIATSTGGPSTVVTTYRGTHDNSTHTTTYNVSYNDSAGPKFTYTQATAYRSAAEFVDEVSVLAPLTLSVSTRASGGVSFVLTNEYDTQRRLTKATNNAGAAVIVTTYSAWDAHGRPTTGVVNPGGPVTIRYDDASRTATTERNVGTEAQTYDTNGNLSLAVQRYGGTAVSTTTRVVSTGRVCK